MFLNDILDKYVKLSNGRVGKVIRIRRQLRGNIAEVEVNPPDEKYRYELVAVDNEQALTDARFKNLPYIVEIIGEKI
ncbi:MAG: hypothetical protein ACE5PV_25490 [Candidatus Poribacteria bacterium]